MIGIIITFVIAYIISSLVRSENERGSVFTDAILVTAFVTLLEYLTGGSIL
jgi:hypothetical protein